MDDNRIISLFWNRQENAIEEADRKYGHLIFGVAWNILKNKEDSEECVNDTYLAAWNKIPPHIPRCLSAFLSKITRNLSIDVLRKKCSSKRIPSGVCEVLKETAHLNAVVKDFAPDLIESKNLLYIIESFLQALSKKDRDIFIQRYWFLMSNKEIGQKNHMQENAVKQNLLRSRRKLLFVLEKEGYYGHKK